MRHILKNIEMPDKKNVRNMFNSIAGSYDKLNHIMSMNIDKAWRRKAIRMIAKGLPSEGGSLLDLACGTGDFSIAAAKSVPGIMVTGLDLSEGMLEVMGQKVAAEGLSDKIGMKLGDGENLPFEEGTFDRVSIAFGIRNFENREQGLREMLRVLKKGGRIVILELSLPENPVIKWLFNLYFLHILPWIGGRISGDSKAYRYLPASVVGFPKKDAFMATMSACGLSNVGHKALSLGICRMYWGEKA